MKQIRRYFNLCVGLLIVAFTFNLFLLSNNLAAIGVSGLSIVFHEIFGIDTSSFVLISNIILIFVSYIALGKESTINTILGSILLPLFMKLTINFTSYFDLSTIDTLIKAIIGGILSGLGYGLIFKEGFTSGGTDILDAIVSKYFKVTMGQAIIMVDGFVVLSGGIVFGLESMIYSAIVLVLLSIYSNRSMLGIGEDKILFITSSKPQKIINYLINNYKYGVTLFDAEGGYSKREKEVIMCSIKTSYYTEIKNGILEIDKKAFVTATNSHETLYTNKSARKNKRNIISC